jgi:hypothetical protein
MVRDDYEEISDTEGMLRIDMPEDFMRSAIYGLIYIVNKLNETTCEHEKGRVRIA